jgi:Ca-activated chloride channel family protein
MCTRSLISILILLSLILCFPSSRAQEKSSQGKNVKHKEPAPLYVKLSMVVTDANYQGVADVSKERLRIFEDEVPQTLSLFEEKAKPLGFVVAVDTSLSLREMIDVVIATAKLLVDSAAPDEKVMLVKFISSDKIERVQDFTSDHKVLLDGIDNLYLEGGVSSILDAISLSNESIIELTKGKGNVRRPIIIITDGEERHSYFTRTQIIKQLKDSGAQVMAIAFQQKLKGQKVKERASNLLNEITLQSGGNVFYPQSVADIKIQVKQIMMEIRAPYVVGYESTKPVRDGMFRKVRIEVDTPQDSPKRLAFVRDGFTAPKD